MANDNDFKEPPGFKDRPGDPAEPDAPPNVLLRSETRRTALFSYLGPVIALFAIVGVALIYWVNRGPVPVRDKPDNSVIGTSGRTTPGGGDPQPAFGRTRDEVANRAGIDQADEPRTDRSALTTIAGALAAPSATPRHVALSGVEVEKVEGGTIWVRDGDARIAVTLPKDAAVPRRGDRVDVSGVTERPQGGATRIAADVIHTK
jgi:hypothetical protein